MTDARLDLLVSSRAIPEALAQYEALVSNVVHDRAPRAGVARPGYVLLEYAAGARPEPLGREIRFPFYVKAGHSVSLRQPAELLADVSAWYAERE